MRFPTRWLPVIALAGCSLDLTIPDRGIPVDASQDLPSADIPDAPRDAPRDGPPVDGTVEPVAVVESSTAKAVCPATHPVLLGGGGVCASGYLGSTRASTGAASWEASCTSTVSPATYALCGTPSFLVDISETQAGCSPGEVVAAGGACQPGGKLLSIAPVADYTRIPAPGSPWDFSCSTGEEDVGAGGSCLRPARVSVNSETVGLPADGGPPAVDVFASCAADERVVSGGCDANVAMYVVGSFPVVTSAPAPERGWMCTFAVSGGPVTLFSYAVCWKAVAE